MKSWAPAERNATEHGNTCIRPEIFAINQPQDEDCLFLNVYVPGKKRKLFLTAKKRFWSKDINVYMELLSTQKSVRKKSFFIIVEISGVEV